MNNKENIDSEIFKTFGFKTEEIVLNTPFKHKREVLLYKDNIHFAIPTVMYKSEEEQNIIGWSIYTSTRSSETPVFKGDLFSKAELTKILKMTGITK